MYSKKMFSVMNLQAHYARDTAYRLRLIMTKSTLMLLDILALGELTSSLLDSPNERWPVAQTWFLKDRERAEDLAVLADIESKAIVAYLKDLL